jgi:hypothetical protein
MPTFRITYKNNSLSLPETVEADHYNASGRFFEFLSIADDPFGRTVVASISTDLVAYIATED